MKRSITFVQFLFVFLFLIPFPSPVWSSVSDVFNVTFQDTVPKQKSGNQQPVYTTSRLTTAKPVIDGKLDDDCWKTGVWAGNYTQSFPKEGAKPTYPTELNIQYDDKNIFIAFRAFDGEPDKILRLAGAHDEFVGDVNVREIPSLTREEPGEEIWALMQKSAFQAILLLI